MLLKENLSFSEEIDALRGGWGCEMRPEFNFRVDPAILYGISVNTEQTCSLPVA
jgi:hypothetical protein